MQILWQLFTVLNVISTCLGCGGDTPDPPNTPPAITCPSIKSKWTVDRGGTTKVVTWNSPTATDKEDKGAIATVLKTGKGSGSLFSRGHHSVIYTATDKGGLTNFCSFSFIVEVPECRMFNYIRNGRAECNGYTYGKTCTFSCDEGYKLVGAKSISCEIKKNWSAKTPSCVAMECPTLVVPKPAGKSFRCTNERKFESICWLTCDEKRGYAPIRGQWTRCLSSQSWSTLEMGCEDIEPPTFTSCPSQTILMTKDPKSDKTQVAWPEVTASDNSGALVQITASSIRFNTKGGAFLEGVDLVKFTAKDAQGLTTESCSFLVIVRAVTCDPPHFDDENLGTPDCIHFEQGSHCQLKCYLALKLNASSEYITCEQDGSAMQGYWDWGQRANPPKATPFCKVHKCKPLRAPNNGALACDKWSKGEQCQFFCSEGYDIPTDVAFTSNLYLCGMDTGKWNGLTDIVVPNCEFREYSEDYRMDGNFYFIGDCVYAKKIIKAQFLQNVKDRNLCPEEEYCTIENVDVRCGDIVDDDDLDIDFRRKRSPRSPRTRGGSRRCSRRDRRLRRCRKPKKPLSYISFRIVVGGVKPSGSFSNTKIIYAKKLHTISTRIEDTSFIVNGRKISAVRYRARSLLPLCRPGLKVGFFNKDSCVPCPDGSFHNAERDQCMACSYGEFQASKGATSCNKCPAGQTTTTLGNINSTHCEAMCPPGQVSVKGVVPCSKCPRGKFQAKPGGSKCFTCPVGMTTEDQGSDSQSFCKPYDIMLQGPITLSLEGRSPAQICDFTFSTWIKIVDTNYGGIHFKMSSPLIDTGIEIVIASAIRLSLGTETMSSPELITGKWTHVAVTWASLIAVVYINGNQVSRSPLAKAKKCPLQANTFMSIEIRGNSYMYLRDMNFIRTTNGLAIKTMTTTCSTYHEQSLFNLEQLHVHSLDRVHEVMPSTCLLPDICESHPCGSNVCVPRGDGYVCVCKGGYSGPNCDIQPDYCKENICKNGATCIVSGSSYKCGCKPGYRGDLCEQSIVDGGWSKWHGWSECSATCGPGHQTRHRFCTNPPPDRSGKPCRGQRRNTQSCNRGECPVCDLSTLVVGKGIITTCVNTKDTIDCSVKCVLGKVFPDPPVNYLCRIGIWTPSRLIPSCTDPVTPIQAGINYTVVFGNSVRNHGDVSKKLQTVANSLSCSKKRSCSIQVGSSVCTDDIVRCNEFNGEYFGSLIVKRDIQTGEIDIAKIQSNVAVKKYLSPLFATWNVFTHKSNEPITFEHRALELKVDKRDNLVVFPFEKPGLSVVVPGQFGNIMKSWKSIDETNWEVRANNYTNFDIKIGRRLPTKPIFLSATQVMTCPEGSVQGGVFCIKCPPGKMYNEKRCHWCRHGYYQHQAGMTSCSPCPGLKTTELLGSPDKTECLATEAVNMKLLVGLDHNHISVFNLDKTTMNTITLPSTGGNLDRMAFNHRDGFIYYSTQQPTTIGRIQLSGRGQQTLTQLSGTDSIITGLDIDIGSGLVLYTTFSGILGAIHLGSGAHHIILNNLTRPRDLLLDQKYGIYWVENNQIKHIKYNTRIAETKVKDKNAIFAPSIDDKGDRLLWISGYRLRTSDINGDGQQTLANGLTSRFGYTDEYYFYLAKDSRLMRINTDLTAKTEIKTFPASVNRMKVIYTEKNYVKNLCDQSKSTCQHGCFPTDEKSLQCFCHSDHTLQKDLKSCRRDFSVLLDTIKPGEWHKPLNKDYAVPPSMTLRFKVKACHSAIVALANQGRHLYRLELGSKRGNTTEVALKKQWPNKQPVVLRHKKMDLLNCNQYVSFWVTWIDNILKVGSGLEVGTNTILLAPDSRPFKINYIMFMVGKNATANWAF